MFSPPEPHTKAHSIPSRTSSTTTSLRELSLKSLLLNCSIFMPAPNTAAIGKPSLGALYFPRCYLLDIRKALLEVKCPILLRDIVSRKKKKKKQQREAQQLFHLPLFSLFYN